MPTLTSTSDDIEILSFLHDVADAAADALDDVGDWGLSGRRDGQYAADLVVDDAVVPMLLAAGCDVLSEESGASAGINPNNDRLLVIVDPLDGSTNASRGIPWFATALCVVDGDGPRVALVAEQSGSEVRFSAIRGKGALCDGQRIGPSDVEDFDAAVIGINGLAPEHGGWWQFRSLGAAALDLCLVAKGALDGYVDFHDHGVWDVAASLLICKEAGCIIGEATGRPLWPSDSSQRVSPIVAGTRPIYERLAHLRS